MGDKGGLRGSEVFSTEQIPRTNSLLHVSPAPVRSIHQSLQISIFFNKITCYRNIWGKDGGKREWV